MSRRLLLCAVLAACRKAPVAAPDASPDALVDGAAAGAVSAGPPGPVTARCRPTEQSVPLAPNGRGDEVEVGDGLALATGYAVGLIHRTPAGRMAAVVVLGADGALARVVDLEPSLADAPPPRLAVCRGELVAAALRLPRSGARTNASHDLGLYLVDEPASEHPVLSIAQHRDDSLAFDVACSGAAGLAVWDETVAGTQDTSARGVIRAAPFEAGRRAQVAHDVSPPDSDAEMPRVLASGTGFLVLWIARRPEPKGGDASGDIEATGEGRAYGWVEMTSVDGVGNSTGPVRRLTPVTGHISAYDVQTLLGDPPSAILLVARDDEETVSRPGGTMWRVRVRGDGVEPPVALPTDGLGAGAPMLVDAPARWLAWVGPHEHLRLQPLAPGGEAVGAPSFEEGLDEARPLFSTPTGQMLVASAGDKAAELRVFNCQR